MDNISLLMLKLAINYTIVTHSIFSSFYLASVLSTFVRSSNYLNLSRPEELTKFNETRRHILCDQHILGYCCQRQLFGEV